MFKSKLKIFTILILAAVCVVLIFLNLSNYSQPKIAEENLVSEIDSAIENALYTRTEFFGAKAIVPFPTSEARENLSKVLEKYPNESTIYLKLSKLDEKLENFNEAESEIQKLIELQNDKLPALNDLASFYNRRGEFGKQAEILNKMLKLAPQEKRGEYFSNLINLAKTHKLKKYLNADFYKEFISQDESAFSILEQYFDKLVEEKNYEEALKFVRESRESFTERKEYFIKKEVLLLVTQNKNKEAENVYYQNFSPDWSDELTGEFYSFLNENDRFKAFGNELKNKFKQNQADFDTAIRLIHYLKYDGDSSENVILALENARAKSKVEWKTDELLTVSLFLISDGNADLASRFLYTLFLKQEANKGGELRAKIFYQLFALLCDSENERIALTKGDLNFYKDIAVSDTNPGITTGILSLIFADENPRQELEKKEKSAIKIFNRAAAYRIFLEYKAEFPNSAQLAQMYLDIIRLYTAEKDFEIAQNTLNEFEETFKDSAEFPNIALKLADAYVIAGNTEKEREVYQKVLDYLGSKSSGKNPLISSLTNSQSDSENSTKNSILELNKGINIAVEKTENSDENYYSPATTYSDFISQNEPKITYDFVLNRFVSSLAKDKKTQEILALYNNEISKYSNEERLYEDFLVWLGQTNFTDEQLEIYQRALGKFQNKTWRDKLARWYIKNQRKEEFSELSHELVGKFNDKETQEYLWTFIDSTVLANPESFEGKLYYALYQKAHERFPHNQTFIGGLLKYYQATKQTNEWRKLLAEYYFEMPEIRQEFLADLSKKGELRNYLSQAIEKTRNNDSVETLPYKLFRADASAKLSNFEDSVVAYHELNRLYPNTSEFSERLINFTRSFGQTDRKFLTESAEITHNQAEFLPVSAEYRTRAGELQAELGEYEAAKNEWQKLISTAKGEPQTYLNTATVFWDYFQYDDALNTIKSLRLQMKNDALYAFQTGAIYEAKHDKQAAIAEYVKQLGAETNDVEILLNISQTKKRLEQLSKRENSNNQIKIAFENEKKNSTLILNYAHFLVKSEQKAEAISLLNKEVAHSNSENFLLEAKMHYENLKDKSGERLVLEQLAKTAKIKKNAISYQLQLAEDFSESGEKQQTAKILADLINKYPTNYGVLSESDEFYWRIGFQENSLEVLQKGINLGRGNYKYIFKRKLASRLTSIDRTSESEQILLHLHNENKEDTEVFDELANIYVHENKPENLRKIADETLETLKKQDLDSRELNYTTADWHRRLINSFTRLKDYGSAVAQHIEIINRQPDDEENIEAAIKYVRRFGGAEKLLKFYKKLAADSYKNYRWTLVLARIYEADKDFAKSIENYKLAIHNQPEMVELYISLTDVYLKDKQFEAAIETINKVLELAHETPNYLKRKIEILEQAGRTTEAEIIREKLTGIKKPERKTLSEEFAEAARLSETEKAKAVAIYRNVFNKVLENPLDSELKSADIIGYVKTVRQEDSLNEIAGKLWNLREKLIAEIENQNSADVGKARNLLTTLDGAFPEAIGNIATQNATGNELDALYRDIENRIEVKNENDKYLIFSLLQNLITRCGFTKLEEKILIARKDKTFNTENFHGNLRLVLKYYEEKGNFARVLEVLESESLRDKDKSNFNYQQQIADVSKLLNNREKELQALKNYFDISKNEILADDNFVNRYLEMLYANGENGRTELANLAKSNSQHQLQIINFFIAKNEKELAHSVIGNAFFSKVWKAARNAETSLALTEFAVEKTDYFVSALQFAPIGELLDQKSDETKLNDDNWFQLTYKFGNWLKFNPNEPDKNQAEKYLSAITENRPKDANEQFNLGVFYLQNKDFARALEHLKIAQEMNFSDKILRANLGIAYFQTGEHKEADKFWNKIIEDESRNFEDLKLYFRTLSDYGQAGKAREKLFPILTKIINETPDENPSAELLIFLREISASFRDENEKAEFWLKLTNYAPKHLFIAKFVVEKSLVEQSHLENFYQILIERSVGVDSWSNDSEYVELLEMNWSFAEAETILEQEKNFEIVEPEDEKIERQKEYLNYLLQTNNFAKSRSLISEIEKSLQKNYSRPVWLRLARFQTDLENGISTEILQKIKSFVGIADVEDAKQLNPPNLERLNDVIKLLKAKNFDAEILDLREEFYARSLALGKYNLANFNGLAEVEFEKNENKFALELLQMMVEISFEETRETGLAQLHSLELIKEFSAKNPELFEISEENNLSNILTLNFAAEISAKFSETDFAIDCRQKLLIIAPEHTANKIELARLFALKQNSNAAVKHLSSIISDRNTMRIERWQALFVVGEIIGNDDDLWQILKNSLSDLETKDREMSGALQAISLTKTGNSAAAIQLLDNADQNFQSPQILFLKGIIAKNSEQNEIALKAFLEIKKAQFDFDFFAEKPFFQIIRLYLKNENPNAVLKIAEDDLSLKTTNSQFQIKHFKFQTLKEKSVENLAKSQLEIFALLSKTAEEIGDFAKAVEFEKERFELLSGKENVKISQDKIDQLEQKIYEQNNQPKIEFRVDAGLVSQK